MKKNNIELINVPSFVFDQHDEYNCVSENAIHVQYYNGTVTFRQNGQEVNISSNHLKSFCREVLKYEEEASNLLEMRK